MLTHEEWVNGARNNPLFGAPPPANPVRNTKRPNDRNGQSFGRLVLPHHRSVVAGGLRRSDAGAFADEVQSACQDDRGQAAHYHRRQYLCEQFALRLMQSGGVAN